MEEKTSESFCTNCGGKLKSASASCENCGMASGGDPSQMAPEPVPESTIAQADYVVRETMQPAQKPGKTPMIVIAIAAIIVVAVMVFPYAAGRVRRDGQCCKSANTGAWSMERGWRWGGHWTSPKDYQHFEKNGAIIY